MTVQFKNRTEAGRSLALELADYANRTDVLVLGLPRGGVPVAYEVAKALNAPLDVCLVRKLGVPGQKELAMGAIALGGVMVFNDDVVQGLGISQAAIDAVAVTEQQELERRDRTYRGDRPAPNVQGHTVILVDDGIATGSTLRAALVVLKQQQPHQIVVAVPVASPSTYMQLKAEVDKILCLTMPERLHSISFCYEDFSQTTDEEVRNLLARASCEHTTA